MIVVTFLDISDILAESGDGDVELYRRHVEHLGVCMRLESIRIWEE